MTLLPSAFWPKTGRMTCFDPMLQLVHIHGHVQYDIVHGMDKDIYSIYMYIYMYMYMCMYSTWHMYMCMYMLQAY